MLQLGADFGIKACVQYRVCEGVQKVCHSCKHGVANKLGVAGQVLGRGHEKADPGRDPGNHKHSAHEEDHPCDTNVASQPFTGQISRCLLW